MDSADIIDPTTNTTSSAARHGGSVELMDHNNLDFLELAAKAINDPLVFNLAYYRSIYKPIGDATSVVADYARNLHRAASPYFDPDWYHQQHLTSLGLLPRHSVAHYFLKGKAEKLPTSRYFDGQSIHLSHDEIEAIIKESGLFDADWYRYRNPDVVKANVDPLKHYVRHGATELKRTPNALFDNTYYKQQSPDLLLYKWHPLVHYIILGSKNSVATHPLIDTTWLSNRLPTLGTGDTPLKSLIDLLASQQIGPNKWFDPAFYVRQQPMASAHPGGVVAHYMDIGWREGADPSEHFSTAAYLECNPDVRENKTNALLHYITLGRQEGRNPKPTPQLVPTGLERFGHIEYGGTGELIKFDKQADIPVTLNISIAVHLHLFYTEMADEFCQYLANIPTAFHLFLSVPEGRGNACELADHFRSKLAHCSHVTAVNTVNRGRDIAPFLVTFGSALLSYDVVLHLHTKRSPHSPKHAGWRRYLLHHTLGNSSVVAQIISAFQADTALGLIQPPYHPEVRSQPKWGDNRRRVSEALNRLGLSYTGDTCPDFPAGSFFWARTDALRPLLDGGFALEEFDEEAGQTDGTLAHGIERLFGLVPLLRGYTVACRFIDVAYNLVNYYGKSRTFSGFDQDRSAEIVAYQETVRSRNGRPANVALVTVIIGPFDSLLLPKYLEPEVDYYCISDTVTDGYGVYRIQTPPYIDADPRRSARYIKANLIKLFPGYDFVIWVDANVLIQTRVATFVSHVRTSGHAIGAIPHPIRSSYVEEANEAIRLKLDDAEIIKQQLAAYEEIPAIRNEALIETNFMIFDSRNPVSSAFQQLWWSQINKFSRRDQLSINYALFKSGASWTPLLTEYMSTRDSPSFALFRHGLNAWGPKPHIYHKWHKPNQFDAELTPIQNQHRWSKSPATLHLDVVVCVHNALDDVKLCLESVRSALRGRGATIVVDDASGQRTANFLNAYALKHNINLIKHGERQGYTRSANDGLLASTAKYVLFLNSDTILPDNALDKIVDAFDRNPSFGIIGPLSNAASFQSVPSTANSGTQTAINPLPPGMTPSEVDAFLERTWDGCIIRTPLVHGFCFGVRRTVFEKIGRFDDINFPRGYGEENDFCFRAADAGFDLGVLTNTYVFHAKSKSYSDGERTELMQGGMRALISKHGKARITRSIVTMESHPSLIRPRNAVSTLFDATHQWASKNKRSRLFLMPALRSDGGIAGSGYVRVLLPYGSEGVRQHWEVMSLHSSRIPKLTSGDAVIVQRDGGILESKRIPNWINRVKDAGARLIYEVDDDLLDSEALISRGYRGDALELAHRVKTFAQFADCVTVSSNALLKKFLAINSRTVLVHNALDQDLWQLTPGLKKRCPQTGSSRFGGRIVIGYVGTPTHDRDLDVIREAMHRLSIRYPGRIDFRVIGGFSPSADKFGYSISIPAGNDYPSFSRWLRQIADWDIAVAPLSSDPFNNSKSFLKYLEYAALGVPAICSPSPEYASVVVNGQNGLLADNTTEAWLAALSDLIEHPERRALIASKAYDYVCDNHTLRCVSHKLLSVLNPAHPTLAQ